METRTRIEEIIWCEGQAAELARDSEELRWTAARLIAQELDAGRTQRDVAADIGKGQAHVSFMFQVHKIAGDHHGDQTKIAGDHHGDQTKIAGDYHGNQERSFDSWYQEIKDRPPAARREAVKELAEQGESGRAIAKRLGMDEKTVRKAIRESEVQERRAARADAECETDACTPLDPYPGTLSSFRTEAKLIVKLRRIQEDRKEFDAVRRIVDTASKALDKIEEEYHQ